MQHRLKIVLSFLAGWCLTSPPALAQPAASYPEKTVRIIMPFLPGGPTDLNTRYIADKLKEAWGQAVIVENRPGANGLVGEEYAAKSKPDGYTLMATSTGYAINPFLYKMPYDPVRDFIPVTQFVSAWQLLVVNNDLPAKSLQ